MPVTVSLPGLYNAYNALAASATGIACGESPASCALGLTQVRAAFGRMERIAVGDKTVQIALARIQRD